MARGRKPKLVQEPVPDELRCASTPSPSRAQSSFEQRLFGAMSQPYRLQSRFQLRLTKARSQFKPLKFQPRLRKARTQSQPRFTTQLRFTTHLKPLNCYKRRKARQHQHVLGSVKELPPGPLSSPSTPPIHGLVDTASNNSRDSTDNSDNQNPSSIVKDPTVVPKNVEAEGNPNSEASVSALPNSNADTYPNLNSSSNWFQKTPTIWNAVEKLKVFNQAPQQPHFMKLQSYPPEMREGAALGLMVTYANLIDSIVSLSLNDDGAVILGKIACLDPLEENGFDVGKFRTRLRQLLQRKTEYTELESRISRLELEMVNKETEMAPLRRVQLEMEEVSREINLVKEKVNMLMVKRDQLLNDTVQNGHDISQLKEAISDLNRSIEPARQEFASLLIKPL